jgi:hypothetical protein
MRLEIPTQGRAVVAGNWRRKIYRDFEHQKYQQSSSFQRHTEIKEGREEV